MKRSQTGKCFILGAPLWLFYQGKYYGKVEVGRSLEPIHNDVICNNRAYYVEGFLFAKRRLVIAMQPAARDLLELGKTAPLL